MAQTQRQKIVSIALKYEGVKKGSAEHHELIDTFNEWKPDGYTAHYSDYWCAEAATAWIYLAGLTKLVRGSASCVVFINKAKADGIWVENDGYSPDEGDFILYDWDDGSNYAKTDNKNSPEHIGIVIANNGKTITVLEGNMGSPSHVGRRTININGRYIRGFICPKYDSGKSATGAQNISQKYKVLPKVGMNVREKPSAASKRVGGIGHGKTFTASRKSGNWVYSSAYKGWVCLKEGKTTYLKPVK